MTKVNLAVVFALGLTLLTESVSTAKGPEFTDPSDVDRSYQIQGEYQGRVEMGDGPTTVGVQVIALGENRFRAVGYSGGLPGDGWVDGGRPEVEGELKDGAVLFQGEHASARWQNGQLAMADSQGNSIGTLNRIERKSPTLGAAAPASATVLFDGTDVAPWRDGKMTADGLLMQGTTSHATFGNHRLHIEFRLPYQPEERGQQRGNSGIYLQGRYEVQMLDSFGLEPKDNECGGVYGIAAPRINMCFPPLTWQTYDIEFHAAAYDDEGNVKELPRMTVRHNGVLIHENLKLPKSTTASPNKPGPTPGPIYLQDHGNSVRYRNIWVDES